ncbi:MAG: PAS domain-containing protein [Ruminococcus sp.]|nr:PAS domain-containing protein [Ruminococcus sp.]
MQVSLSEYFKSIVDSDSSAVVICNMSHEIIYMNPAAIQRYAKRGGSKLVGSSILDCHNEESGKRIKQVTEWFAQSPDNNRVYTYHNPKENKDVYMIALRNDSGGLIGYYEKHEYRDREKSSMYDMK